MSIICNICLQEYKNSINSEKTPRILSCGDTFCTACLKRLKNENNIIKCPICGKISSQEIENITPNKFITDLIEEKILATIKPLDNKDLNIDKPDYHFSIALVGESEAGKTSIINFYREGKTNLCQLPTISLDNTFKFLTAHEKTIKITLWDTAGEERYRSISIGYLRGVHAIILVFSLTNLMNSLDFKEFKQKTENEKNIIKENYTQKAIKDLEFWLKQCKDINSRKNQIIYLVGNKVDIDKEYILIKEDKINDFVLTNDLKYYETSALTGEKIEIMFCDLISELLLIYSKSQDACTASSFKLKKINNNNKSSCKC